MDYGQIHRARPDKKRERLHAADALYNGILSGADNRAQNGHANTQSINQDSPNHFPNEKDKALEINEMKASEKHKTHTDASHPKQEKLMSNIDQSKQTKIDKSTKLNICNNQNNTKSHINIHDSANFTINSNSKVHYPSSKEQNSQNLNKKIIQVENNKKNIHSKEYQ